MKVEKEKIIKEMGFYVIVFIAVVVLQTIIGESLNFLLKPFAPYVKSLPLSVGLPLALLVLGILLFLIPLIVSSIITYKFTHSLIKTIVVDGIVLFLLFLNIVLKGMQVAWR